MTALRKISPVGFFNTTRLRFYVRIILDTISSHWGHTSTNSHFYMRMFPCVTKAVSTSETHLLISNAKGITENQLLEAQT